MTSPLMASVLVGAGGMAGSIVRYGLSVASQRLFVTGWPLGTMAANVLGCLVIGVIAGLSARGESISPETRLALATGFCGGFTTMSSMIYETAEMVQANEYLHAALYVAGSLVFSFCAFVIGLLAVRILFRTEAGLWN